MAFFHVGSHDFMLQTPCEDESTHPSTSALIHHQPCNNNNNNNPHHEFLGSKQRPPPPPFIISTATGFAAASDHHIVVEEDDQYSDDDNGSSSQLGGEAKKRRLNVDQVRALERSFELGNKLEPERKLQLARALGLQPRQIAIWFQNRRARWKTKQLERDYEVLKRQFDAVRADNVALHSESQRLHAEILALKTKEPTESINLNKETEGSCSNKSENSSEIRFDISRKKKTNQDPNMPLLFPSLLIRQQHKNGNNDSNEVHEIFLRPEQSGGAPPPRGHHHVVKEESGSLCNMLCGADEQSGLCWPWLDPHHYN